MNPNEQSLYGIVQAFYLKSEGKYFFEEFLKLNSENIS